MDDYTIRSKKYEERIIGVKTITNDTVQSVNKHAIIKIIERNIYIESILNALRKGKVLKGNKPNRIVFSYNSTCVVFDKKEKQIVTVIYKGKSKKR